MLATLVLMPLEGDFFIAQFAYCRIRTWESAAAALQYHTFLNTASRVEFWVGFPQSYVDAWILNLGLTYTYVIPNPPGFYPAVNQRNITTTSLIHVQSPGLEKGE